MSNKERRVSLYRVQMLGAPSPVVQMRLGDPTSCETSIAPQLNS